MATKSLTAFGMTFNVEESTIESGFKVLDTLREEKTPPFKAITALAKELKLTSAVATALYAEWMATNKPIF